MCDRHLALITTPWRYVSKLRGSIGQYDNGHVLFVWGHSLTLVYGTMQKFLAITGTVMLGSACVSGTSGTNTPTPLPQYAAIGPSSLDAENAQASDQVLSLAPTEGLPVPATGSDVMIPDAADSSQLASQFPSPSDTATVAKPAFNSVPTPANRQPTTQTANTQPVAVAAVQQVGSENAGTLSAAAEQQPSSIPRPAAPTAASPTHQTQPARKQSFLSRLFGNNRKNNRLIATDGESAPRTAALSAAANQQNPGGRRPSNPLPGVKSNSEIFGIEENNPITGKPTQVAALGGLGRLTPNGLRLQHDKVQVACLKPDILHLLAVIERHYGKKPIITSGYRSPKRNRRAGGAKNSMHIFCRAVDIQVEGVSKWDLAKYLRTIPGRGGVGTYCRTRSVHIDTGKVRDWNHPCRRSSKRRKKKA